jgi:hypothetical protein
MEQIGLRLQQDPDDKTALEKFMAAQERCIQFIGEKRDADCDRDLKYNQGRHGSVQSKNFYRWCDKFASNKNSYKIQPSTILTKHEKCKKLEAHDLTFIDPDPDFKCKMNDMLSVTSERRFNLKEWDPAEDSEKLVNFIRSRPKIDPFYKIHAEIISKPLFLLLNFIDKAEYFPRCMRTSKATLIPDRTIFSLDVLTKIIESVLSIEFGVCTLEDFDEHGDPEGFAYRKGRSVLSCVAITLTAIELSPRNDNIDCVLCTADLKKAFNSTNRSTVVREAQRIAGAGRIIMTRWVDRVYTFEDEKRGYCHNRGTDAGAMLSVWGFDRWISTDTSTQMVSNSEGVLPVTLAPCNFSDDRNPNSSGTDVENGRFQGEVLNKMVAWANSEGAAFHTKGAKAPGILVFSQKIKGVQTRMPYGVGDLTLDNVAIRITERQRILGLVISTQPALFSEGNKSSLFKSAEKEKCYTIQAKKLIDTYGYFLEPNLQYLIGTAYRLQSLREEQIPEKLRMVCMGYIVGKIQFGIALHYIRSTKVQLNTIRFYYAMAVSAVANLSAYETLGASCCANQSVGEGNGSYELLLQITGFQSIRQLAIKQAKSIIKCLMYVQSGLQVPIVDFKLSKIKEYYEHRKIMTYFFQGTV